MFAIAKKSIASSASRLHHFQRIDVWVNNAGHGLLDSVAQMDMAACREMFDTNFFGTVACHAGRDSRHEAARFGRDHQYFERCRASSLFRFMRVYSATKFAMNAIGKAARVELRKTASMC